MKKVAKRLKTTTYPLNIDNSIENKTQMALHLLCKL